MDPFLESPAIWPVFHHQMVATLHQDLIRQLGRRSQVHIGERRYQPEPIPGAPGPADERREGYLEIREANGGLVTLVDVVSPANRTTLSGRRAYLDTREQARAMRANLVEIDLVLQGRPMLDYSREGLPDWDHAVTVTRSTHPDRYEIYTATLQKRLPRFRLPWGPTDRDTVLDLQSLFTRAYEQGGFATQIDYRHEPAVPLTDTHRRQLGELLHWPSWPAEAPLTHDEIAVAAYYLWKEEGCPDGRAEEHWRLATERLEQRRRVAGRGANPPPITPA
jgi:hypothetical protein